MTTTDETGVSFQILGALSASINGLSAQIQQERTHRERLTQALHPFVVSQQAITLSAGAGTLDQPNLLGPRTGKFWDLRRISCTGFSAGTVTVYLSQPSADVLSVFSTAGVLLLGKAHIILGGNDRLYFSAASITGSVTISIAGIEVDADRIGCYLS
jgi:hypothetical protein